MRRTNLYLTDDQERALDARARLAGISRSALVRRIIDDALTPSQTSDPVTEEVFGRLAAVYHDVVGDIFEEDPDLRVDR